MWGYCKQASSPSLCISFLLEQNPTDLMAFAIQASLMKWVWGKGMKSFLIFLIFLTLVFHLALDMSKSYLVQGAILPFISDCCKKNNFSSKTAQKRPKVWPKSIGRAVQACQNHGSSNHSHHLSEWCVCVNKECKAPQDPKRKASQDPKGGFHYMWEFCPTTGMWYWCRKARAGLGGCGAISQVKKIPLGQRAHIPLKTAMGLLTTVNSSGLWDPGDLPPPGLLDTPFTAPNPSWGWGQTPKTQTSSTPPHPPKHTWPESGVSWPPTDQHRQEYSTFMGTPWVSIDMGVPLWAHKWPSPVPAIWQIKVKIH